MFASSNFGFSTYWQMVCCTVIGQGAGVAAAVSIKEGTTVRNGNISEVQENLTNQGVQIK
ncbi:MAG: FAD-dependent oxidoreductase [Candidatus Thorarchaeota archaeon]